MIKKFNNKKKKGFTLVELIAVIAIIGILAAVIVPMVGKYTERAKISKGTEQMREFVMSMETGSAEVGITITTTEQAYTPITAATAAAAATPNPIAVAANAIVPFTDLTMIQGVSFDACKAVMNGSSTASMGTGDDSDTIVVTPVTP